MSNKERYPDYPHKGIVTHTFYSDLSFTPIEERRIKHFCQIVRVMHRKDKPAPSPTTEQSPIKKIINFFKVRRSRI